MVGGSEEEKKKKEVVEEVVGGSEENKKEEVMDEVAGDEKGGGGGGEGRTMEEEKVKEGEGARTDRRLNCGPRRTLVLGVDAGVVDPSADEVNVASSGASAESLTATWIGWVPEGSLPCSSPRKDHRRGHLIRDDYSPDSFGTQRLQGG